MTLLDQAVEDQRAWKEHLVAKATSHDIDPALVLGRGGQLRATVYSGHPKCFDEMLAIARVGCRTDEAVAVLDSYWVTGEGSEDLDRYANVGLGTLLGKDPAVHECLRFVTFSAQGWAEHLHSYTCNPDKTVTWDEPFSFGPNVADAHIHNAEYWDTCVAQIAAPAIEHDGTLYEIFSAFDEVNDELSPDELQCVREWAALNVITNSHSSHIPFLHIANWSREQLELAAAFGNAMNLPDFPCPIKVSGGRL